ncbi:MAG: hypothetical protein RR494_04450 [Vagococcus sp.]|uniref:hypothetical protein n=1 Tax=Vagococcus sp. TaxID=1933889 RepID=UPI002FC7E77E
MWLFSKIKQNITEKKDIENFREELKEREIVLSEWKMQDDLEQKIFDNSFTLFKKGEELSKKGNQEEALVYLKKAYENGYREIPLYHRFTIVYRSLKMYDEEIYCIDKIISELDNDVTDGWRKRREKAIHLRNKYT